MGRKLKDRIAPFGEEQWRLLCYCALKVNGARRNRFDTGELVSEGYWHHFRISPRTSGTAKYLCRTLCQFCSKEDSRCRSSIPLDMLQRPLICRRLSSSGAGAALVDALLVSLRGESDTVCRTVADRIAGYSFMEIGKRLGMSRTWCQKVYGIWLKKFRRIWYGVDKGEDKK